jgi:hypothetical protein
LNIKRKLVLAGLAYGALASLAWLTLSNDSVRVFSLDVRLRTATLLIVGLFAFKTLLHFWRVRIEEADTAKAEKSLSTAGPM